MTVSIQVIEGPDGVGKSTYIKNYVKKYPETKVAAFPGNRGGLNLRDCILSEECAKYPTIVPLLFIVDFIHMIEYEIVPKVADQEHTHYIFDRFVPSLLVYQQLPLEKAETMFSLFLSDTGKRVLESIDYVFLTPGDIDGYMERLFTRSKEERNRLDPELVPDALDIIDRYKAIERLISEKGLCGSHSTITMMVAEQADSTCSDVYHYIEPTVQK